MTYYAEIDRNGVCFAELETDSVITKPTMIVTDGFGKLNKQWTGAEWVNVPAPVSRTLTKLEYLRRFTQQERVGIRTAAKTEPVLEDYLALLDLAQEVSLDDPDTVAAVTLLELSGLIAQGRAAEILA